MNYLKLSARALWTRLATLSQVQVQSQTSLLEGHVQADLAESGKHWKTKQTKHRRPVGPRPRGIPWRLFQARSQHAVASARLNGLFYTGYTQQLYPKKWKLLVHFKSLACHLRVTCKSLASDAEGLLYLAAGLHTGFKDTNHGLRRKEETEESTGIPLIS